MANSSSSRLFAGFLVLLFNGRFYANGCYTSIISFGDSITDTGNLKQMASVSDEFYFPCLLPPYGENFIKQSTGRCSNGRLIIDFLAESLGLPLVPPFVHNKESVNVPAKHGVNYAVAGATALDSSFLEEKWPENSVINASLEVQLSWFKQSLPSICGNASECRNFIGRSVILMGEIGGNDYSFPLLVGRPIDEAKSYVALVVDTIVSVVNELIEMGAQTLVVPGNFPIGCSSSYLTSRGSDKEEYDPTTGCLANLNEFAEYHNGMLQTKLNQIRELHPNVNVIYADYYNAALQIYRSPDEFGFTNGGLKACCGGGGPFNYNTTSRCGDESSTVCDQPDTYVSWDGVHLTEAAYKLISKSLFLGSYTTPQFSSLCPTLTSPLGIGLSSSI